MSKKDSVQDQRLKLRVRRVLWAQGFHCPLEVDLSHYEYDEAQQGLRRSSFTDIDVLAVRFDPDLRRHTVVADCKSGIESEPNRIFWLKGIMSFFGADGGLFVKSQIHAPARALAPRLGIRSVDEIALTTIEQALKVDSIVPTHITEKATDDLARSLWGIKVARNSKPTELQLRVKNVYQYLQYLYWMIEEYRNIQTMIDRFSGIAADIDPDDKSIKYLCYVGLQRFVLSVLTMASEVAVRDIADIERQSKIYLFGGNLSLRERQHTFALLNKIAKEKLILEPPYFVELIEIVNRLIKNSRDAAAILSHLDTVIYEIVLCDGNSKNLGTILGSAFRTDAVVLAKRIAALFQRAATLKASTFSELMGQ